MGCCQGINRNNSGFVKLLEDETDTKETQLTNEPNTNTKFYEWLQEQKLSHLHSTFAHPH